VLYDPRFISGVLLAGAPVSEMRVTFDVPMDVGVVPAFASLEVTVDGAPQTPTLLTWNSPTELDVFWGLPAPAVSGVLHLLVEDPLLRSAKGVPSWSPQQVTFFP